MLNMSTKDKLKNENPTCGNTVLPAVYHCESCGFISTRRKEYTYIKGVMFCIGCKEDYESGVENVTRWVTSALNGR
jgi:hypothetical protein